MYIILFYLHYNCTFISTFVFYSSDYEDFNESVLYVEFPTDRIAVEVAIPIVDDDIDEADEQVFIIFLEVFNATNLDNLIILENRDISLGKIRDDESKYVDRIF